MMLGLLILAGTITLHSCEDDAPEFSHSAQELADSWVCTVLEGDAADGYQMEILTLGDNEISIKNFHNLDGEEITVKISGTSLSFSGELMDGNVIIENGSGNISNGWLTMTLTYDITADGETEHMKVQLDKRKALSKKTAVYVAR